MSQLLDGLDAVRLPRHGEEGGQITAVGGGEDNGVHPHERHQNLGARVAREKPLGFSEVHAHHVQARVDEGVSS